MTSMLRFCHPATNRFEDLRPAQFRNQQSECVPAGCSVQLDITARSRPPFDDSGQLKFPQRTSHRGSGCAECFHEFRLARKPLAWFILARCDCIGKGLPDFFVLRQRRSSRGFGNHGLIIQVACTGRNTKFRLTTNKRCRYTAQSI